MSPPAAIPLSRQQQYRKNAHFAQRVQGLLFLLMGGVCLFFPNTLLRLSLKEYQLAAHDPFLPIVFACFGAQACLCAVLLLSSEMTEKSFMYWAASMLPFIIFDVVYYENGTLTVFGALGDFLGNIFFLLMSVYGAHYCTAAKTEAAIEKKEQVEKEKRK